MTVFTGLFKVQPSVTETRRDETETGKHTRAGGQVLCKGMPSEICGRRQPASLEGFDRGKPDKGIYTGEAEPEAGFRLDRHEGLTVKDASEQRSQEAQNEYTDTKQKAAETATGKSTFNH